MSRKTTVAIFVNILLMWGVIIYVAAMAFDAKDALVFEECDSCRVLYRGDHCPACIKADQNHNHSEYAFLDHEHAEYAALAHGHSEYALLDHEHSNYAPMVHEHSGYAPMDHEHSEYASVSHDHNEYAPTDHNHPEYAPEKHTHPEYKNNYSQCNSCGSIYLGSSCSLCNFMKKVNEELYHVHEDLQRMTK